jgi:16S rRNA pseudouridine516 synthase
MVTSTLERILHSQGFGTRRECRGLVRAGRITVNGAACDDPFAPFATDGLEFTADGEPWRYRARAYLLLNKPAGYECARAPLHHPSVFALLPPQLAARGVQCVGRLDEDTTGVLLLSDDGQFIHAMGSGKRKVPKVYEVTAKHPVSEAQIAALLAGVQLHDEPAPVAAAACERIDAQRLRLTLTAGKYHQVKRMIAAAGNRVEALTRVAVGDWVLPEDLPEGQWRWIEPG